MDSFRCHQIETPGKFYKYNHFITKILQFLVPISLLSLLLSYTSGFSFRFSHNFTLFTLNFPVFYHAFERKYMFLICNGILAFLSKSLSFSSTSSVADTDVELTKGVYVEPVSERIENEETNLENVSFGVEDHEEQEKNKSYEASIEEAKGGGVLLTESEGEEEEDYEEEEENGNLIGSSSTVEEEGNEVNVNTEELNKKFEEFIRKMKEEIRIEAQQRQPIAVNYQA